MTEFLAVFAIFASAVAVIAVSIARGFSKTNAELRRANARLTKAPLPQPPPKTPEQQRAEHLDRQLEAVIRERVTFCRRKVMNGGEFELFRAAMGVTCQPYPSGWFPFYVFPQVSLGQIIGTEGVRDWASDQAHRAINSKRCDLLIADRQGTPIAVLEYQGAGHNMDGTATRRDEIKRIALKKAGVRFIEIANGTANSEIQRTIRELLAPQQLPTPPA
jgi:hypothetical protein